MFKVVKIRQQLLKVLAQRGILPKHASMRDNEAVIRCLASALGTLKLAQRIEKSKRTGTGAYKCIQSGVEASIHPSSCVFARNPPPSYIVFDELVMSKF